jgi:hypothetical protein
LRSLRGTEATAGTGASRGGDTGLTSTGTSFRPRKTWPMIAGGVAVAAGLTWYATTRRNEVASAPPPPASPSTTAAATPSAAAPAQPGEASRPAQVSVYISATPAEARLTLDGAPLAGNPFRGTLPRDERDHTLRIEADGHIPKSRTISFRGDVVTEVALDRLPVRGGGRIGGGYRPPPTQHQTTQPPETPVRKRTSVGIDTESPY